MAFGTNSKFSDQEESSGNSRDNYFHANKIPVNGDARLHVLSDQPLEYYELWCEDSTGKRRTVRFEDDPSPADIEEALGDDLVRGMDSYNKGQPEKVKSVMAFVVYNYEKEKIQIAAVNQKTIINQVLSVATDEDYQPFTEWDLKICKRMEGDKTTYDVKGVKLQKGFDRDPEVAKAKKIKLEALLTNENPFA